MATIDLFSKRKRWAEKAGKADVYQYDELPRPLRVQIAHIWLDAVGRAENPYTGADERWKQIHNMMAREKGVFALAELGAGDQRCINWMLTAKTDDALDIIELTFRYIHAIIGKWYPHQLKEAGIDVAPADAIQELNDRFREHSVGYQFENGILIRIDSQFIHAEIVKPALTLLAEESFRVANGEFLLAHQHYRESKYQDCIVSAQRAFESTLKAICAKHGWKTNKGDRSTDLIKTVRAQGLFPDYLDAGFDTYIAMLKTGLPSVRNSAGGHGPEPNSAPVPSYIASYALHMTATNIVLAVEACQAHGRKGLSRR